MADGFLPVNVDDWARCRPWIEAALKRGGDPYEIEDVERFIAKGDALFWPGRKSAAVTEFMGNGKILSFWLLGGDLDELLNEMRPAIEAWAKARGCVRVLGIFSTKRRGWQRVLAQHGYAPAATTLVKEL
jgi:hypothetical protein